MIQARLKDDLINLRCNDVLKNVQYDLSENPLLVDLINIFLELYVADIGVARIGDKPRDINVNIFIYSKNIKEWEKNRLIIEKLADFVTEGDSDKWHISFIPVEYIFSPVQIGFTLRKVDNISLLSGGLDSYCGAYFNEINNKTTLYCGYKTSNVDTHAIQEVSNFLRDRNGCAGIVTYTKVDQNKIVYTQRTRSLLFFSLAVLTAKMENIDIIKVNENGIMTLNPSFESRGTTKTTHPKTIYLFQSILNNMGIDVTVQHPFLFMTKGQMVNMLSEEYKNKIILTRSCSRSMQDTRYDTSAVRSCGTCVPCLLRKISMAAYELEKYDNTYVVGYEGDVNDSEYRSAYNYFSIFNEAIKNGSIFSEINIKGKYYEVKDYYEQTYKMLNQFSREFEIFRGKYGR